MTTKEKIKRDLDDLPNDVLERVLEFIKSVKPRNSGRKKIRSFKLGGRFDKMNIRERAYE